MSLTSEFENALDPESNIYRQCLDFDLWPKERILSFHAGGGGGGHDHKRKFICGSKLEAEKK